MTSANRQKLQEVFRVVFEIPPTRDVEAVSQSTENKWDSLAHITLLAALENEFNIEISTTEALELTSYRTAELLLESRGA